MSRAIGTELRATIKEPKVRVFFDLLTAAARKRLADIDTLPDIPNGKYLQLFENKTFDEYLKYLGPDGIGLLNAEQVRNQFDEKSKSPKFFHYFLQEFHRLRAIKSQSSEDQTNFSLAQNPGEPSVKDACKRDKKPGETLSHLSGSNGRYDDDITGTLDVGDIGFSYSETVGTYLRRTQEDSFIIGAANAKFSDSAAVPELLRQEFQRLGQEISSSAVQDGSTAVLAHYSTDQKLTIANAGDARAVLFIKRKLSNGKFEIEAIRATNDNEPLDVLEIARINALGGLVSGPDHVMGENRVNGSLMAARSFGDNDLVGFEAARAGFPSNSRLISFDPDIYQYNIAEIAAEAGPEAEVFLLTSCDGLYDHDKANEVTYASIVEEWFNDTDLQDRWSGNISEYLRDCAIYLQSKDNVTVTWANITKAPTQGVVVGVFDGHGGEFSRQTNAVTSRTLALEMGNSLLDPDKPKVVHAVAGKSAISELKTLTEAEVEAERKRIASLVTAPTPSAISVSSSPVVSPPPISATPPASSATSAAISLAPPPISASPSAPSLPELTMPMAARKPLFVFNASKIYEKEKKVYEADEETYGSYLNIKKLISKLGLDSTFRFEDEQKTISYFGPWQYIKFCYPLLFTLGECFKNFRPYTIFRHDAMDYFTTYSTEDSLSEDRKKLSILTKESHDYFKSEKSVKEPDTLDQQVFSKKNLCIGEGHSLSCSRRFIMENISHFADQGYKTLFLEHLFYDSAMQDDMNNYMRAECPIDEMPGSLKLYLESLGKSYCSHGDKYDEKYNFFTLVRAAKQNGLKVVGIDTVESYKMGDSQFGSQGKERMMGMNYEAKRIIEKESGGQKWIALMGNTHISKMDGVAGVSEIIPNSVAVDVYIDEISATSITMNNQSRVIAGIEITSDIRIACKKDSSLVLSDIRSGGAVDIKTEDPRINGVLEQIIAVKDIFLLHHLFTINDGRPKTDVEKDFAGWYAKHKIDLGRNLALSPTITATSTEFFQLLRSSTVTEDYNNLLPAINSFLRLNDDSLLRSILNKFPVLIDSFNFLPKIAVINEEWQKYVASKSSSKEDELTSLNIPINPSSGPETPAPIAPSPPIISHPLSLNPAPPISASAPTPSAISVSSSLVVSPPSAMTTVSLAPSAAISLTPLPISAPSSTLIAPSSTISPSIKTKSTSPNPPPIPRGSFKPTGHFQLTLRPYIKKDLIDIYTETVETKEGANSANSRSNVKLAILLGLGFSKEEIFASAMEEGVKIIVKKNLLSEVLEALNMPTKYIEKAQEAFQGGIAINRADIGALFGDRRFVDASDKGEFYNLADSLNNPGVREDIYKNYFDNDRVFDRIKERKECLSKVTAQEDVTRLVDKTLIGR